MHEGPPVLSMDWKGGTDMRCNVNHNVYNTRTKDLLPEYQPYEKFMELGPEALSDAELLAIILRTGSRGENSIELARRVLMPEGDPDAQEASILNIFRYELHELRRIRGIGKVKAIQIKSIAELSRRIAQGRARKHLKFTDPESIAAYYMEQLRHRKEETVVLLMLNSACDLIGEQIISTGAVNFTSASPREIFLTALKYEAVSVITLHNHPSGSPKPSALDYEITECMMHSGDMIGISLLDHIIIGDNTYYSFRESGFINE